MVVTPLARSAPAEEDDAPADPNAPLPAGGDDVPVLDFGAAGPPRCRRCRAYINPFMQFSDGGAKFTCNMCLFTNNVPAELYAPLDATGARIDRHERPELLRGTVDFAVPEQFYEGKPPEPVHWLFAIDVSADAVNKHLPKLGAEAIRKTLYGQDGPALPPGSKVAIVTFDRKLYFYNLSAKLDQAQMIVMSEVEDAFVPLVDGLFVDPDDSRLAIESLLDRLDILFEDLKVPEPAYGAVLDAALQALLPHGGGKVSVLLSTLPTWGPGALAYRDDPRLYHTDKERSFFLPSTACTTATAATTAGEPAAAAGLLSRNDPHFYRNMAARYADAGIGLDLFAFAGGYMDLASTGFVSELSGGEVYLYPNFTPQRDGQRFLVEFERSVGRNVGYRAQMKVRCSNGLQVAAYHGNFYNPSLLASTSSSVTRLIGGSGEAAGAPAPANTMSSVLANGIELGSIDEHKSVTVTFKYDGRLDQKLDAHFQAALLYTTPAGQRRVRCINLVAGVTDQQREIVKFCDQDAVVATIAREAAGLMRTKPLKEIRNGITEKCVEILAAYRRNGTSSSTPGGAPPPPGQLILPEALKELTVYMLCLLKSKALRGGNVSSDARVHSMRLLRSLTPDALALYLYPRVYGLHNLAPGDGYRDPATGRFGQPATIVRPSMSRLDSYGAYIADNGQGPPLLYLPSSGLSPLLLQDLFGERVTSPSKLDAYTNVVPYDVETGLATQVRSILGFYDTTGGATSKCRSTIQLARQGLDGAEYEFAALMVEDRNSEAMNYVDYLCHVHKHIQLLIANQKTKRADEDASLMTTLRGGWW
ncbi:uncharacterized protein V1510DRAFT_421388 [Dipodascopsis tothii]|uniref:uncharacterized protein n=1 Tax=Dipodascopsis tothii TaxID=44089 RepID=UPI0034CE0FAF